ncbi:hypothetical protein D3C78_1254750 [compost metagenome]
MPKSSIDSFTPSAFSSPSSSTASCGFCISMLSVISRSSRAGSSPVLASTSATSCSRLCCSNWRADRLTASRGMASPCASHAIIWRQASRSTQAPIGLIRPVSSASGMKRAGDTSPRCGWRQRISASTPTSW